MKAYLAVSCSLVVGLLPHTSIPLKVSHHQMTSSSCDAVIPRLAVLQLLEIWSCVCLHKKNNKSPIKHCAQSPPPKKKAFFGADAAVNVKEVVFFF